MNALLWLIRLPAQAAMGLVRLYQIFISPLLGPRCRFHPTCSQYSIQALQKYGFIKGSWKSVCRILKCHPWHPGGHDPP